MSDCKINVFVVHTEFHVLTSMNIVLSLYSEYKNYIYYTKDRISIKFQNSDNIIFEELPYVYGNASFLSKMKALKPRYYVFFQENDYDDVYLSYYLSKCGTTIALCEDGLKPYVTWHKKRLWLSVLRNAYVFYKNYFTHKSFFPIVYYNRYTYAFTPKVQELFLRFPQNYNNVGNKNIIQIPNIMNNVDCLKQLFDFNLQEIDNILLYVGQPFKFDYLWEREKDILTQIKAVFPNKRFVYKPHPLCKQKQIDLVKSIGEVCVYEECVPVELLIASLTNSIVVSAYSTGLLENNSSCQFFWFHKMMNNPVLGTQMQIVNPTNHIREISTIEEIKEVR